MSRSIVEDIGRRQVGVVGIERSAVRSRLNSCSSLYWKDLLGHYGCVNALEFDPSGGWLASGGDDRRVLVWNVAKSIDADVTEATPMQGEHDSNIFCLNFDLDTKVVFSGGNDERVLLHDLSTAKFLNQYLHDEPVFGISCHPSKFITIGLTMSHAFQLVTAESPWRRWIEAWPRGSRISFKS